MTPRKTIKKYKEVSLQSVTAKKEQAGAQVG
jgi:hypothetical protein